MVLSYKQYAGTEYTGNFADNGLSAKKKGDTLTSTERNRLFKATGQQVDPTKPLERRVWLGLKPSPNSVIDFED